MRATFETTLLFSLQSRYAFQNLFLKIKPPDFHLERNFYIRDHFIGVHSLTVHKLLGIYVHALVHGMYHVKNIPFSGDSIYPYRSN